MNTGKKSEYHIFDGRDIPHPEDRAMLQALYSRNPGSVLEKLQLINGERAGKLMENFYIGYGHQSIGDCGSFTMFIENVSMIAAKVIQHHPLYNGQEASTRYLDFSQQGYVDPLNKPHLMEFILDGYKKALEELKTDIKKDNPYSIEMNIKESEWEKACNAKAFDIARGLLPLGVKTSLSWDTTFRNFRDHLKRMTSHGSKEISGLCSNLFGHAAAKYPSSFPKTIEYLSYDYFENEPWKIQSNKFIERNQVNSFLSDSELNFLVRMYASFRQRGEQVHPVLDKNVWLKIHWNLDYGSFRDLQRHRNQSMPLPIPKKDSLKHSWYVENLGWAGKHILADYNDMLKRVLEGYPDIEAQYYQPMCVTVDVPMIMSLGQAVYLVETRSSKNVHPTLRVLAQNLGYWLKEKWPELKIHIDESTDSLNLKRGKQDIVKKEE